MQHATMRDAQRREASQALPAPVSALAETAAVQQRVLAAWQRPPGLWIRREQDLCRLKQPAGNPRQAIALPRWLPRSMGWTSCYTVARSRALTLLSGGPGCGKEPPGPGIPLSRGPGRGLASGPLRRGRRRTFPPSPWVGIWHPLEQAGTLWLLEGSLDPAVVLAGDFDLQGLLAVLGGEATRLGARRVVLDGVDVLTRSWWTPSANAVNSTPAPLAP